MIPSGNVAWDRVMQGLDMARQNALAVKPLTAAAARTADIAFHQAVIAAAPAFGIVPLASMEALQELGLAPLPPN